MQIAPQLHMLTIPFTVPLPAGAVARTVNLFLVIGERITLIDSGVAGAETLIFAYLARLGRRPEEISTLILTHSHPDHIGAAQTLRALTGCTVLAHPAEREWIEDTELQLRQRPVPGFRTLVAGPVSVDRSLAEGNRLPLTPGWTLEVLHTPGHSRGSISLWEEAEGVLITGDAVLLPGEMPIFDDPAAARRSLQRLLDCGAGTLLSAWDRPQCGREVEASLAGSLDWLTRIEAAVRQVGEIDRPVEDLEFCRQAVGRLGLPAHAVNPLVAASFAACRHLGSGSSPV